MNRLSCLWLAIASAFYLFTGDADGQNIVWEEDFTGQTGMGITAGPITNMPLDFTKWSVTVHDAFPTNGHFMVSSNSLVKSEYFEGRRLGGQCVWQSELIDISTNGPVDLSLQLQETGSMASFDTIGIYYRLDGSNEILFAANGFFADDFGNEWITASQPYLSGTNLQIVVRMNNSVTQEAKNHRIDNVRVSETSIVSNSPPEIAVGNGETNRFAMVGDTVQFTLTATENLLDAPTDTITLRAEGLPTGAIFATTNGLSPLSQQFSWTPTAPGSETVAFYASDKDGTNRLDVTITVSQLDPGKIWINEIHYYSNEANEGVEIAGPAGYDLKGYWVYFYNGANGQSYTPTLELSGTIEDEGDGFGAVWFARSGIQDGAPDGMALVRQNDGETNVLQFLTYEGSFVAVNGPAAGLIGVDIGVSQVGNTSSDKTLQLTGKGKVYADFTWVGPVAESRGRLNAGQQIVRPGFVFIVR